MFSKIFSSKTLSSDAKQTLVDSLNRYRSETFPQGILYPDIDPEITLEKGNDIVIKLSLPFPCNSELHLVSEALTKEVKQTVRFAIKYNVQPVRRHELAGIKNIIAIASGKGGVGKSTTAVNLAYALIAEGASVGILDADIYGPSIPTLLGLKGAKPSSDDGKLLTPINANGLSAMSLGFLVDEDDATVWRGPMASRAFSQLLNETDWQGIDYLIVDMPPGTGDIQLTLSQQVPVAAAVVITTPQDIALADAIKGLAMFEQVKVPVLGIIENMSYHQCENCGHHSHLFGEGGGQRVADKYDTQLLGQLPLDVNIRRDADQGVSPLLTDNTSNISEQYRKIARTIAAQLYLQLDSRSPNTAKLLIED
ncbi:iron-sulfur cluster carrier protein ApbC [Colwellia hornerae]|uniref:Iron-sulfur cluster carrier protein n=1 Tax=Colwellia hornerae TaxID=89402 RepID=A0A5C6QRQ6_9GAMM|nr:iron-sulfur cluster carrier protein ApbC [Colwellia hornerae]TWX57694.1 iron-sulfur cluster carrier protein ApbC [Colwellia hornerae]TWX62575.1 iron-sulfur cluster carrier protein ApbC [Colwellia hornerae]TWX71487.1 iron-sulfur cluster carrier protein ApbC [Colwellia hornerae]